MKLIHISDLHLGLILNGFDMKEDQQYILDQIIKIISEQNADGVMIAGDIYDKSSPPADAVVMFSQFLADISNMGKSIYMISGNHDSAERINYGKEVFCNSGVYISDLYNGEVEPVKVQDEYGELYIWLLPFIRPSQVRHALENESIKTYNDAIRSAVEAMNVDTSKRNILITHQFVTGAATCDSDCQLSVIVGTTENVNADNFAKFDYTALGHLHGPQNVGTDRIRYCGTPLKYSFSEANQDKSVTVVEFGAKGDVNVRTVPLVPQHNLVRINGNFEEVFNPKNFPNVKNDDYIEITLNEDNEIPDAMARLRSIYPNAMKLIYNNRRTRSDEQIQFGDVDESKSPFELFAEFYEKMNNAPMSEEQSKIMKELIDEVWSDNETA